MSTIKPKPTSLNDLITATVAWIATVRRPDDELQGRTISRPCALVRTRAKARLRALLGRPEQLPRGAGKLLDAALDERWSQQTVWLQQTDERRRRERVRESRSAAKKFSLDYTSASPVERERARLALIFLGLLREMGARVARGGYAQGWQTAEVVIRVAGTEVDILNLDRGGVWEKRPRQVGAAGGPLSSWRRYGSNCHLVTSGTVFELAVPLLWRSRVPADLRLCEGLITLDYQPCACPVRDPSGATWATATWAGQGPGYSLRTASGWIVTHHALGAVHAGTPAEALSLLAARAESDQRAALRVASAQALTPQQRAEKELRGHATATRRKLLKGLGISPSDVRNFGLDSLDLALCESYADSPVTLADSIAAGNCVAGSESFAESYGLTLPCRVRELLQTAARAIRASDARYTRAVAVLHRVLRRHEDEALALAAAV